MSARNDEEELDNVNRRSVLLGTSSLVAAAALTSSALAQTQKAATPSAASSGGTTGSKPNILFIMGDDIGWFNVSAYNMGIMGYRTPNIDRIGREGAVFTDWYGQQSCTAGRAAFITGQSPIRTGLTKVGLPGAELGLGPLDPSVADVMKTSATPPASSARTISATATSTCRRCTASTSSSATSITSTPRRSRRIPTIRRTPNSASKFGPRGVLKCKASDAMIRRSRIGKQDREHRPARHQAHGDGRRGVSRRGEGFHQSPAQSQQAVVLLFQLNAHAHLHASEDRSRKARPGSASIPTAWSRPTATSANC